MARSIKMAYVNGGSVMTFTTLRTSNPYPEFAHPDNGVEATLMRKNSTSLGNRVFDYGGTNSNHLDLDFTLHLVENAEVTLLLAMRVARPPVILFSLDGGTTRYFAVFAKGGCEITGYEFNEHQTDARALLNKVEVKLHILQSTSTDFI